MLDFGKGRFHRYRLSEVAFSEFGKEVAPILTDREDVLGTFKAGRDGVVFTTKRLITIDNQNGRKTDITSIPYSSIDVFSAETAGIMDFDAEIDIFIKGIGKFTFELDRSAALSQIYRNISTCKFG